MVVWLSYLLFVVCTSMLLTCAQGAERPNLLLFFADDMGWGDLSSYGHPTQEPGSVDHLAQEGVRFTQAYTAAVACSPSRASMLTGRLPVRTGVYGSFVVFQPDSARGLPKDEITLAEALRDAGYRTGMVGKWHLGINEFNHKDGRHLPHHHGFDDVGTLLPYSLQDGSCAEKESIPLGTRARCVLYKNATIIQQPVRLDDLTERLVYDAKAFLYENTDQPFFYYFSLPQTHTPLFNKPAFRGKSRRGSNGDQIGEMSWAVGEVLSTLEELNLAKNTVVVFASDHGPEIASCNHGGSAGFFSGGKLNYMEGGLRVPLIIRWPGVVRPGRVEAEVVSLMDLFPTFLEIAEVAQPSDRIIDGRSIMNLLLPEQGGHATPLTNHPVMFFHCGRTVVAARYGPYKVHYHWFSPVDEEDINRVCRGGIPVVDMPKHLSCATGVRLSSPRIYNAEADPGEIHQIPVDLHEDMLDELQQLIHEHVTNIETREPLLDLPQGHPSLLPCCNPPYCFCNYSPSEPMV